MIYLFRALAVITAIVGLLVLGVFAVVTVAGVEFRRSVLLLPLVVSAWVLTRSVVWLWSGPTFWSVPHKRAEVCTVVPIIVGWLGALYYTPGDDPNAGAKLGYGWMVFSVVVYVSARALTNRARGRGAHRSS